MLFRKELSMDAIPAGDTKQDIYIIHTAEIFSFFAIKDIVRTFEDV